MLCAYTPQENEIICMRDVHEYPQLILPIILQGNVRFSRISQGIDPSPSLHIDYLFPRLMQLTLTGFILFYSVRASEVLSFCAKFGEQLTFIPSR